MEFFNKTYAKMLNQCEMFINHRRGHPFRVTIGQDSGRRALLMYLSAPLHWSRNDPRFNWHESLRQSLQIAELLVKAGYQTDVVDIFDDSFEPSEKYDIFIGHGRSATRIASLLNSDCRKICLATGQYGPYANLQVERRYAELELRSGICLSVDLPARITAADYKHFDEIACFGSRGTASTFASLNMQVSPFPNYANTRIRPLKTRQKDSCHFVYIAASRHILKGLDLLLNIFSENSQLHLHIFGKLPKEIREVFKKELACRNIHQYGYVRIGGRMFNKICKISSFYILPSCSEGLSGAVLNAMVAGLIPIVSTAVDVDISGCGFRLKECSISEIRETVEKCVLLSDSDLKQLRKCLVEVVAESYTPDHFSKAWLSIITHNHPLKTDRGVAE